MRKRKLIGLITIIVGLPGLGGLWLIGQLDAFPFSATIVVMNAIFFRGICGVAGGALIWRGSKWGYYLVLLCWLYLIVVSMLTIIQLYNNGLVLSYEFLEQNYSAIGKPFLISVLKIVVGIPIVRIALKDLLKSHTFKG